jgi:hypothetical protein
MATASCSARKPNEQNCSYTYFVTELRTEFVSWSATKATAQATTDVNVNGSKREGNNMHGGAQKMAWRLVCRFFKKHQPTDGEVCLMSQQRFTPPPPPGKIPGTNFCYNLNKSLIGSKIFSSATNQFWDPQNLLTSGTPSSFSGDKTARAWSCLFSSKLCIHSPIRLHSAAVN